MALFHNLVKSKFLAISGCWIFWIEGICVWGNDGEEIKYEETKKCQSRTSVVPSKFI